MFLKLELQVRATVPSKPGYTWAIILTPFVSANVIACDFVVPRSKNKPTFD